MTAQTKQVVTTVILSIGLVIFLLLLNRDYAVLTRSEINILINQCNVVRDDYKAALERVDFRGNEDPETRCFDSLEDMRDTREVMGGYLDGR
jgi:hypothetical protein